MKFSATLLEVWLKGHMSINCHGITSLLSGSRDSYTVVYKSDGRGRIFCDTQLTPSRYLIISLIIINFTLARILYIKIC